MIQSLLIANRGEIACRIIRTARAMGIRTVAVYSDADAQALHVRSADEAVHIGPAPVRESYLLGDRIIAAALQTGAQSIHPGYGFLSENAEFAQAVIDAGLIWVGPNPSSITAMGLKDAAKQLMQNAGVPTTPGYLGADQSPAHLAAQADAIGYPVLIKAVAGGGGKGMRKVDAPADFADALTSCQREAASSFGNDHVLLEKWVTNPRHIEVQVFGDSHGNVVHLFERDCSLQRRHQKVIEEAPAPGMDEATREAICSAAVRAAQAVNYVGAGTIEFIADGSEGLRADRIWFMEMNTRLQVEHPVTEEITGVDLVEWQLRVASGEPLPLAQDQLNITGHAMEARLYAEDPATGFLPSPGKIERFVFNLGARVEAGVDEGDTVSTFYDPMIAKVICHGADREEARTGLLRWMDRSYISPLKTNKAFLFACLSMPNFRDCILDTGLIEREGEKLTHVDGPSPKTILTAGRRFRRDWLTYEDVDERHMKVGLMGFRLNASAKLTVDLYEVNGARVVTDVTSDDVLTGLASDFDPDGTIIVTEAGQSWLFSSTAPRTIGADAASDGAILSPMPGRIIAVAVAAGDAVVKGQKLLTLEAMKMEHSLIAPFDGTVAELNAAEGGQVSEGVLLAKIAKTT